MSDPKPSAGSQQNSADNAFSRPQGVDGAFAPSLPTAPSNPQRRHEQPAAELSNAFGKATNGNTAGLQRPPQHLAGLNGQNPASEELGSDESVFWPDGAERNLWRDPGAPAALGEPLPVDDSTESTSTSSKPTGPMLSLPELLFGRRVAPVTLLALFGVVLVIGMVGGVIGWGIARMGNPLNDATVTLSQVDQSIERAAGSIADIAKRVQPAVVSIEVENGQTGTIGSGVMIDKEGYILTNNHVVSLAATDTKAQLHVVFSDGTKAESKIVGTDPKTDLAVIKVSVTNPTVITLGKSSALAVGDQVIAVGSPLGLAGTVTSGIVSALHRSITAAGDAGAPPVSYDAIQTDAAINHGNSGGALVDATGALVGINSAIAPPSANNQDSGSIGIGFAIPIDFASKIAEGLIHNGKVNHADLGLNAKSVSAVSSDGAQVQNVKQGGAANQAGITEGDVIVKFGDRPIRDAEDLAVAVIQQDVGQTVPVQLVRQGRTITVSVTLHSD